MVEELERRTVFDARKKKQMQSVGMLKLVKRAGWEEVGERERHSSRVTDSSPMGAMAVNSLSQLLRLESRLTRVRRGPA